MVEVGSTSERTLILIINVCETFMSYDILRLVGYTEFAGQGVQNESTKTITVAPLKTASRPYYTNQTKNIVVSLQLSQVAVNSNSSEVC